MEEDLMKKLFSLVLALCMLLSVAACAQAADKTVLKISNYAVLESNYTEFWNDVEAGFEAANPEYDIVWVTSEYSQTPNTVITSAGGGDYCDGLFGELSWTSTLAYAFEPVDDVLTEETLSAFDQNILASCVFDGDCYAIPYYVSPFILYYNTDLFAQAGIEVPTTYDELMTACEKLATLTSPITGNPVVPFGQTTASVPISGTALTAFIYNFGGSVLDLETGLMSIDNDGFRLAMETLQKLYNAGYMTPNQKLKELRQSFANGELAMYYDQSWGYSGMSGINPDAVNFTASAPALSGGEGKGESVLNAAVFMVSNKNGNADGMNKFINYVTSDEVVGRYIREIAPAWSAKIAPMDVNPVLAGATGSQGNLKAVPMIETLNDLNLELDTLAQNVTLNGMSVDAAIEEFVNSSAYQTIGE